MKHSFFNTHTLLSAAATALLLLNQPAIAQNVHPATSGANIYTVPLEVCRSCGGNNTVVQNNPTCLNADMIKTDFDGANYNFPSQLAPSAHQTDITELFGVAYSGINNAGVGSNYAGFTLYSSMDFTGGPTQQAPVKLPHSFYSSAPGIVNDPDIALGHAPNFFLSSNRNFALVVYEQDGEIFLEHYDVNVDGFGGVTATSTLPPAPCTTPPCAINVSNDKRQRLSDGSHDNRRPRIDVWHAGAPTTTSDAVEAMAYAVVWEKEVSPGQYEVLGVDGAIQDVGYNLPVPNACSMLVQNAKHPDVVAVSPLDGSLNDTRAYFTYVAYDPMNGNAEDVRARYWWFTNNSSVSPQIAISATTGAAGEYSYPRISGPAYYDFRTPAPEPVCAIVYNDKTSGTDVVSATKVYVGGAATPTIQREADITNWNSTGFSNSSKSAIQPVTTGAGLHLTSFSAMAGHVPYENYPVMFYSEHSANSNFSGDYYSFGIDPASLADPILNQPDDEYYEVNTTDPDHSAPVFSLTGDIPALAIATSNNSGNCLINVFYDGDITQQVQIQFMDLGSTYDYKPGRPSGISTTAKGEFATYPNPVTDVLNIVQANGAAYTVTDAVGRILSTGTLQGNKAQVGTLAFTPGMYILTISKDGRTEKVKFIKTVIQFTVGNTQLPTQIAPASLQERFFNFKF